MPLERGQATFPTPSYSMLSLILAKRLSRLVKRASQNISQVGKGGLPRSTFPGFKVRVFTWSVHFPVLQP
jgi:hypothetical protein